MPAAFHAFEAVADRGVALAWAVVWQSTLLALVIGCAAWMFRRSSPAVRYWLWQMLAIKLLLMPFWTMAIPILPPTPPQASTDEPAPPMRGPEIANAAKIVARDSAGGGANREGDAPAKPIVTEAERLSGRFLRAEPPPRAADVPEHSSTLPGSAPSSGGPDSVASPFPPARPIAVRLSWQGWLALIWTVAVVAQILRISMQRFRLRRLLRRARSADPALLSLVRESAGLLNLPQAPRTVLIDRGGSPFVCGLRRPVIVCPAAVLQALTESQLRQVLLHELAHVKRRDLLWGWIPEIARLLYFFHPVAHWTCYRIRLERELACDQLAMTAGGTDAGEYAETLVRAVSLGSRPVVLQTATVHCGCSSQLSPFWTRRIAMLPSTRKAGLPRRRSWLSVALTGILVAALPTLLVVSATAQSNASTSSEREVIESPAKSESASSTEPPRSTPEPVENLLEIVEPPAKPNRFPRTWEELASGRERREHSAAQPEGRDLNARDAAVPRGASGADVPYSMGGGASLDLIALANSYLEAVADVEGAKQEMEIAERTGFRGTAAWRLRHVERRAKLLQRIAEVAIRATQQELDLLKDETNVLEQSYRQGKISGREVFASRRKLHEAEARLEILQAILSASQPEESEEKATTPPRR